TGANLSTQFLTRGFAHQNLMGIVQRPFTWKVACQLLALFDLCHGLIDVDRSTIAIHDLSGTLSHQALLLTELLTSVYVEFARFSAVNILGEQLLKTLNDEYVVLGHLVHATLLHGRELLALLLS